jgi:hypothetical protein
MDEISKDLSNDNKYLRNYDRVKKVIYIIKRNNFRSLKYLKKFLILLNLQKMTLLKLQKAILKK